MLTLWYLTALILLLLYIVYDVNYFLRTFFTIIGARLFKRKFSIHDVAVIYGVCTLQDADITFRHMRTARILRELDFARYYYYERTGLYSRSRQLGIKSLQAATHVIMLQTVPLFWLYKIETRLVYWDECSLFFHHELVTLTDGCRRALLVSRQHAVDGNTADLLRGLPGSSFDRLCPIYIRMWLDSLLIASGKLRQLEYNNRKKLK